MGELRRGSVVPLPAGSEVRGSRALLPFGADFVCAARLPRDGNPPGKASDLRVLPVAFDASGERKRQFAEAAALLSEEEPLGGRVLSGPSTALWCVKFCRDNGGSFQLSFEQWKRAANVNKYDRACYEMEVISRSLDSLLAIDQVNLLALVGAEILCRRWQLIREAYKVSPNAPDFSAADEFMGWGSRRHGGALAPALGRYVSEELRAQASVAKEARKAKEEKELRAASSKQKGDGQGFRQEVRRDVPELGAAHPPVKDGNWRDLLPLPMVEVPVCNGHVSRCIARRLHRWALLGRRANAVIAAVRSQVMEPLMPKDGALMGGHAIFQLALDKAYGAVSELLKYSPGSYDVGSQTTVVTYDRDLVSWPDVGKQVPSAHSLLDDYGREILSKFSESMLADAESRARIAEKGSRVVPYMDEKLRGDLHLYLDFVSQLHGRNMIDFTAEPLNFATPFFVRKKSGRQRLVWDCRASNEMFTEPSKLRVASGVRVSDIVLAKDPVLYTAQSASRISSIP
eukprot:5957165-Amphidinium_carterae.2